MSSIPGSGSPGRRPGRGWRLAAAASAGVVLAAHLATLSPVLDDIDAVNLALGVKQFDPTRHQPHPPGYPLYVALGRITTPVFEALRPEPPRSASGLAPQRNAAQGLAVWSAIFAGLALWPLAGLYARIERLGGQAPGWWNGALTPWAAAAVAIASPLFWFTASRPLTDVPGLVASLAIQLALLARIDEAVSRGAPGRSRGASGWPLAVSAAAAASAIGLRSQSMWLTLPLLAAAGLCEVRHRAWGRLSIAGAAFGAGTLTWAIPVIVASGGVGRYLAALGDQGASDFSGVDMWYRTPTLRRMAFGLYQTFVLPWDAWPLAALVLGLAAAGLVAMWRFRRASLGWLALAFGPYALFHLVFHETATTRYALPLIPPTAYLAMVGARWTLRRGWVLAGPLIVVAGLALGTPALVAAASSGTPVTAVIEAMAARASTMPTRPVLALHYKIEAESRRAFSWMVGDRRFWSDRLAAPPRLEWKQLAAYWRDGGRTPVWFLANPSRADLALVDPRARHLRLASRWPFRAEVYAGRARPDQVDWYEIDPPGWFAGEGWSLTPETAGVATSEGRGPSVSPIDAWVRRRTGPVTMMVGGRNLGPAGAPRARVRVMIDGREVLAVEADPAPGFFLRIATLPAGTLAGPGPLARLTIGAEAAGGGSETPPVAIEQFDLQDEGTLVYGFDTGWHELEHNPDSGALWRWTDREAALSVCPATRDLLLEVSGENPRRYFSRPARLDLRAGAVSLGTFQLSRDFALAIPVPAGALAAAQGRITLSSSETFVPDEREGNGDRRRLGLRIYSLRLSPR